MTQDVPGNSSPDPAPVFSLIDRTRKLLRLTWVATGSAATLALLLIVLLSTALLDLMLTLSSTLRMVALLAIVVPTVWALVVGVFRPLVRRMVAQRVARRIELHLPKIHNRLVSCVDLVESKHPHRSAAFYERLVREAVERVRGFQPWQVVDRANLQRAASLAGASLLVFLVSWMLFAEQLPTAMARIFHPFADIPPATGVRYVVAPGNGKVLRGNDVTFHVTVEKGFPEALQLELRGEQSRELLRHDLQQQSEDSWTFTLSGYEESFEYRVLGGGTWSPRYRMEVIDRPRIVGIHTVLHFPDYMESGEPRVGPPQTADVTGPMDSKVDVVIEAEGTVAEGSIQLLKPQTRQIPVTERVERVWVDEKLPEGAQPGGNWQWDIKTPGRPIHHTPPDGGHQKHFFQNTKFAFEVQPGESLFAWVYIPEGKVPETLMLEFHDGAHWEHRAYWGADKIGEGQPNSISRKPVGPLPPVGQWHRLEVPAKMLELEGKTIRGISFARFNGHCLWSTAGAIPAAQREVTDLVVAKSLPLRPQREGETASWLGSFPLDHSGLYRVELLSGVDHEGTPIANKTMKEAKYIAIPDNPPQVRVEKPAADLVVSEPRKVPIVIGAYDDFGLASVEMKVQIGDSGGFTGRPERSYKDIVRNDNVVSTLDLVEMGLKVGQHVRYRVAARDRKGQSAETQDFVIRIVADGNAADRQLANLEKTQDTFKERLVKLIGEQAKVKEKVQEIAQKYAPVTEKVRAAQAEADLRPAPQGAPNPPDKNAPKPLQLDPDTARKLEEMRKEIAQLAGQENQNAQQGQQLANEMKQAVDQAENLQLLPPEMARQMQAIQQAFADRAVQPLQDLAAKMQRAGDANQPPPDAPQLARTAERAQQELEASREQMEAMNKALAATKNDVDKALAELEREMERQRAGATNRELAELEKFLEGMVDELKRLEGNQEQFHDAAETVPDLVLPDVEKRQQELDKKTDKALADAKELLDLEQMKKARKRDPSFPDAPYEGDTEKSLLPPVEEDPPEEQAPDKMGKEKNATDKDNAKEAKDQEEMEEDAPLFMPVLGGERPELDPRFADKRRPVTDEKSPTQGENDKRQELRDRQRQRLQELNQARQSLASDENTLENLREQFEAAMRQNNEDAMRQLAETMRSLKTQKALAMAARMQKMLNPQAQSTARQAQRQMVAQFQPSNSQDNRAERAPMIAVDGKIAELDLNARTVILQMQPQMREELLQGMRDAGPEGYQKFIKEYFSRLTRAKTAK